MTFQASRQLRRELVRAADAQARAIGQAPSRSRRRRFVGLLGAVALVVVPAGAAATGALPVRLFDPSPRTLATAVQADQRNAFKIFAEPRTAADVVPTKAASMIGDSQLSGRNLSLSRAISTLTGRGWAIPGNRAICLAVPDPTDGFGITCVNTSYARSFGVLSMMASPSVPGDVDLTLLLANGASATVRANDGSSRPLVSDLRGVVAERLSHATEITIVSPTGQTRSTAMPVPPQATDAFKDDGRHTRPAHSGGLTGLSAPVSAAPPGVAPSLYDNFAILRRPRTPADQLPAGSPRGTPDQSRLVSRRYGVNAWMVPGTKDVCLIVKATGRRGTGRWGGGGCGRVEDDATYKAGLRPIGSVMVGPMSWRPHRLLVTLLLPDGTSDVYLRRGAMITRELAVENNAVQVRPMSATSIWWRAPDGSQQHLDFRYPRSKDL